MPTKERIQAATVELTEKLADLGYHVDDFIGPVGPDGEQIDPEAVDKDSDRDLKYYLFSGSDESRFYILFKTGSEFAYIVYPMDILRQISTQLGPHDVEALLNESVEWQQLTAEEEELKYADAVRVVIENTDQSAYYTSAFNLTAYASTALVEYRGQTTDTGFPTEFQCVNTFFPFTEQISLANLDDRIRPVIIAGSRGRRYAEYAFQINKEPEDASDYEIHCVI